MSNISQRFLFQKLLSSTLTIPKPRCLQKHFAIRLLPLQHFLVRIASGLRRLDSYCFNFFGQAVYNTGLLPHARDRTFHRLHTQATVSFLCLFI